MKRGLGIATSVCIMIFTLASCMPKEENYAEQEQQNIQQYIASNPSVPFVQKESGLYYVELFSGTGNVPGPHDTVGVFYTAKFLTGYQFDSNTGGDTLKFAMGSGFAIPGFEEGISYMNTGAKARVLVPSDLAYGPYGYMYVPGYTPILFDIHLVKIIPGVSR